MKKLLAFTLIVCIISIVGMICYFLASTDIYHDYIGTSIRERGIIDHAGQLPEYTKCSGEWAILQIDYLIRFFFMILITVVLIRLIRREK